MYEIDEMTLRAISVLLLMARYVTADEEKYKEWLIWVESTSALPSPQMLENGREMAIVAINTWSAIQKTMLLDILSERN